MYNPPKAAREETDRSRGSRRVGGKSRKKSEVMERSALHSHFPPPYPHYFSIKLAVLVESQHPHRPPNPWQRAQRDALIDVRQTYDKGEGTGAGRKVNDWQ